MNLTEILAAHAAWRRGATGGRWADLSGANLSGAYLSRADLSGADLSGANLSGADLSGAKGIIRVGPTSDGYEMFGVVRDGAVWIKAGCRWFTAADARTHWQTTRGDTPLGRERLAFVDMIEAVMLARVA